MRTQYSLTLSAYSMSKTHICYCARHKCSITFFAVSVHKSSAALLSSEGNTSTVNNLIFVKTYFPVFLELHRPHEKLVPRIIWANGVLMGPITSASRNIPVLRLSLNSQNTEPTKKICRLQYVKRDFSKYIKG